MTEAEKSNKKVREGVVISDKMDKTRVVQTVRTTRHLQYNKVITRHAKFKVHDPKNESRTGDIVRIVQTRPISKEKRWRLLEIVAKHQKQV